MLWPLPASNPWPDPALTRVLAASLPGGRFSGPLAAFGSVSSTQSVCRAWAGSGAPEGAVVVADHQTAGLGRHGRPWVAPAGTSLLVSCLLRPPLPPARWPELTILAGCAVAEAIEQVSGLATRLRWPNDVLVMGRKVAGILADGVIGGESCVVLGIGVNLLQRATDWPPELEPRAASLAQLGASASREALLGAILRRLAGRYESLIADGFASVRAAWRGRAALGGTIRTRDGEGIALDLAPDGGLIVRYQDGSRATILVGGEPAPPATRAVR